MALRRLRAEATDRSPSPDQRVWKCRYTFDATVTFYCQTNATKKPPRPIKPIDRFNIQPVIASGFSVPQQSNIRRHIKPFFDNSLFVGKVARSVRTESSAVCAFGPCARSRPDRRQSGPARQAARQAAHDPGLPSTSARTTTVLNRIATGIIRPRGRGSRPSRGSSGCAPAGTLSQAPIEG